MNMRQQIFDIVRSTVREIVGDAQIILFGSRARGNYMDDSDWDILVLIDEPVLTTLHKTIDYEIWRKGLDYGQEINTVVRTKKEWDSNPSLFKVNVTKDGIRL